MSGPTMRRGLSPLTSASLEGGNLVLRQYEPLADPDCVSLRPEEWRALAVFLVQVEAASQPAEDEPMCGAIRPEDDAYCVELEGHQDAGLDHLWVGGVRNLCLAAPVRLALPAPEPQEGSQSARSHGSIRCPTGRHSATRAGSG